MRHKFIILLSLMGTFMVTVQGQATEKDSTTTETVETAVDSSNTVNDRNFSANDSSFIDEVESIATGEGNTTLLPDSIPPQPIHLSVDSSATFLLKLIENKNAWSASGDTLRESLQRLVNYYFESYDSVQTRLSEYPFDSIQVNRENIVRTDSLPVRWLNDSTFFIDTVTLDRSPVINTTTIFKEVIDSLVVMSTDTIRQAMNTADTLSGPESYPGQARDTLPPPTDTFTSVKKSFTFYDTISESLIDTLLLQENRLTMFRYRSPGEIYPPIYSNAGRKSYKIEQHSALIYLYDTANVIMADQESPLYILPNPYSKDSLHAAVETLISHIAKRDSVLVYLNDVSGNKTPFWLTVDNDDLYRFWLKNYRNDSITVWVGNPNKYDITLFMEEEVQIDRPEKKQIEKIPIPRLFPESNLAELKPLKEIPVYWDYDFSTLLGFNQTYLANWSKGGESSIATMLDIKGKAQYHNKQLKTKWLSTGRLKYGSIYTDENGMRKNTDQFEINSQYNKEINEKLDFSTTFYMKNQIAKGYKYPNDSVPVSKFLNPGTFTLGVGVEYKPFKKTILNYSPLSYKNTFVLDTAAILDHTIHGIDADKLARQEMGGQLVATNSLTLMKGLDMSNSVRLFMNYFSRPINVDVDWEINLEKRVNWYFTISLNMHLIYDKDVKFPVLDDNEKPILLPDGSELTEPRIQFKEFVGLNFSFSF